MVIWRPLPLAPTGARKNILVIDHHVSDARQGFGIRFECFKSSSFSGSLVIASLLSPTISHTNLPIHASCRNAAAEVVYHPYVKKVRDYLLAHGPSFDAVVLSRCDFARKHLADVRLHAPQSRIIFDTVDLHYLREDSEARLTRDPEDAPQGTGETTVGA